MVIHSLFSKRKKYSDAEVVTGLQQRDRRCEDWFYNSAHEYFNKHFNKVFFDKDQKQEIFQTSFLKLWTEIENGKISVIDGNVSRMQPNGEYKSMTCSLTTFLMAFARTDFRELVRNIHEEYYEELYDGKENSNEPIIMFDAQESIEAQKARIVDDCIQSLSPRCIEILTLFYYQGKSLDEIMELRKDKNTSKNGLKTSKNKCMNRLAEDLSFQFKKYNIKVN